jgi:cell division cycle 20-like protein 1 (cofactor of APC complex)
MKQVRVLTGHKARVGAISWCNPILASGSRDKNILFRDIRLKNNFFTERKGKIYF